MTFEVAVAMAERFPHDFTLQYPPRREYFQSRFRVNSSEAGHLRCVSETRSLLLYVHVPFCAAKCSYCNFAVDLRQSESLHRHYVNMIGIQLERLGDRLHPALEIPGIDIGGGTPTLLDDESLALLLRKLEPFRRWSSHPRPISIETTPSIAAMFPDRMRLLAAAGVDRISMGLQSTSAELLANVNRCDQINQQTLAVDHLVKAGFSRINVDLIFGLPDQTLAQWSEDLSRAVELPVTSITVYDCLYRGKGRSLSRRNPHWPSWNHYGDCYDLAYDVLRASGFHATYGSLNFSRIPTETGTSPYFEGRLADAIPYLGVGNYASSILEDYWWFAPYRVDDWLNSITEGDCLPAGDFYRLPLEERLAKQILLSLSFGEIRMDRLKQAFGPDIGELIKPAAEFASERGWLVNSPTGWKIRVGAFREMPKIRALFYANEALNWLEDKTEFAGLVRSV